MLRFLLNGALVELPDPDPTASVLDLLRYRLRKTGTKEGCAEGDCGACTILVGTLADDAIDWRAVNACILFVAMLDGRAVLTVEGVGTPANLHPVQAAMVERHGSQCGFCTPGFVMSLYARHIGAAGTAMALPDLLAGNLCRCTGYGAILAAAEAVTPAPRDDAATVAALAALRRDAPYAYAIDGRRWSAPRDTGELAAILAERPDARLVAGATDVGLWVTKQHRQIEDLVWLGNVADLAGIEEDAHGLTIGAATRYADAADALARLHPQLGELVRRIGGAQVRNAGTIGGNIANGSPIGDMPPALIALGASLTLRHGDARRTMPLEDYFIGYGVQDRAAGEFVERLFVPRPPADAIVAITKLSKRFDSDISGVCGAIVLRLDGDAIGSARIAFGGMAAIPKRAPASEAALIGRPLDAATIEAAAAALAEDYRPLDDLRGSARYRLAVAANLLRRLLPARAGEAVSVLDAIDG